MGEINHQRGLVPCNMVSEVHINDPEIAAQLLEESRRPTSHSAGSSRTSSRTSEFTSRTHSTVSILGIRLVALLKWPLFQICLHCDNNQLI